MADPLQIDERLKEWATARQIEFIDAVNLHGSASKAERALGVSQGLIARSIRGLKKVAALKGYSPDHDFTQPVPDGFKLKRHSQYYDAEGNPRGKWVIATADDQRQAEMFRAAVEAMAAELPRVAPIAAPAPAESKLCNLFTLTDSHVGMLAYGKEGGDDWDLQIAEETLSMAFAHLVASSPRARVAVVNQLGDFLHQDSNKAITPAHGHLLDADSRFRKIIGVAIRVLRRVIDAALATHDEVHVVMAEGNHDEVSSIWLQVMFAALYENEPRVTVNDSALPYYVFQHGKTMLGFHHGHMKKNDALPLHFAASYPEIWGRTTKRYVHVGHRHHVEEKEHSGVKVVQHSTLAARDAYAARGGWHSERQAIAITYHEDHGEVARVTVTPGMLQ